MRRLFLAATCVAVLFCAAPVASALEAPLHGHRSAAPVIHATAVRQLLQREPVTFTPLAGTLPPGPGVISLNVYTYDGQPEVGAAVRWVVDFGNTVGWNEGDGTTDADGHVVLEGVPAADPAQIYNAEIVVRPAIPANVDDYYHLDHMSWPAEGFTGGLQPGRLPLTIVRTDDSEWGSWPYVKTMLWTERASADPYKEAHVARDQITVDPVTKQGFPRTITTGTESLAGGTLYFWQDQGMELPVAGTTVRPGMEATPVTVDQADAQRVFMAGWGSGKPGTRTSLVLDKYPAGWVNAIKGQADFPKSAPVKVFFEGFTTTGAGTRESAAVTIPSTAVPGYKYYVWADRTDGWFGLVTSFQTCSLKPSKTAVARGRAITLSGVVPIQGHRGTTEGVKKWVTIYKTTSAKVAAKAQPRVRGGATVAGWTKIARVRTDGLGRYKLSTRLGKTAWYCAWYPGDSWYWSAWTSVSSKVAVR